MRIVLLVFLMSLQLVMYCQNSKKELINPESLAFKELPLFAQREAPSDISLPFESIRIIDSRFDTSKIGFIPVINILHDKRSIFRKFRFKDGVAKPLQEYYNKYYKNLFQHNGFELLIVMKRFWISGVDVSRDKRIEFTNSLDVNTSFYIKWEYYLGKDGKYLPVRRTDTIAHLNESDYKYLSENFDERKLAPIKCLLKAMIELYDFDKKLLQFDKLPGKTMEEITAYNIKRNEVKALKDSVLQRGIYLSFDEFKNNAPSIKDFNEEKMKYKSFKSERYLTDLQGNLISEYWGFSDGQNFRYGKYGNDKIYRVGNAFEFFVQINNDVLEYSTLSPAKAKIKVWFPYQIDMESGYVF